MNTDLQEKCKKNCKSVLPTYGRNISYLLIVFLVSTATKVPGADSLNCKGLYIELNQLGFIHQNVNARDFTSTSKAPPLEFNYTSQDGSSRYFRDGSLWQLVGNNWVSIGYGRFDPTRNHVYEDSVSFNNVAHLTNSLPDLTPLKSYRTVVSSYEADKYYPNVNANFPTQVHRLQISTHTIEIFIPKSTDRNGWSLDSYAGGIINTLRELPFKRIEALKTVRLNTRANKDDPYWQKEYKNFSVSAATAGGGSIDIYGVSAANFRDANNEGIRVARHEFGHLIAEQVFGKAQPDYRYTNRASQDSFSPSEYAKNSWAEDFAEGIESYLRYDAGRLSQSTRNNLSRRFAFFDDVFNYRSIQSLTAQREILACKDTIFVRRLDADTVFFLSFTHRKGLVLHLE